MAATRKLTTGATVVGDTWVDDVDERIDDLYLHTTNLLSSVAGTSTAYTATASPPFTYDSLQAGVRITFSPHVTSGASPTLAIDGLTAVDLRHANAASIGAGDLVVGYAYSFYFTGGVFRLDTATSISAVPGLQAALDDKQDQSTALDEWALKARPTGATVGTSDTQTLTSKTLTSPTINGGTITGITDLAVADGGTGSSTASAARIALGVVIGTNVQAWSTALDEWAGKERPTGQTVGTSDAQTLTGKTIDYDDNTIIGVATPGDIDTAIEPIEDEIIAARDGYATLKDALSGGGALAVPIAMRPGEDITRALFTEQLDESDPRDSEPFSGTIEATPAGRPIAVFADSAFLARRSRFPLEPGRTYIARYVVQRIVNATDPENNAVRCALAYYGENGAYLTGEDDTVFLFSYPDSLSVSDGRQEVYNTVSLDAGAGVVAPAGAISCTPYVRIYGNEHRTGVEVIDFVDVTDGFTSGVFAFTAVGTFAGRTAYDASPAGTFYGVTDDADPDFTDEIAAYVRVGVSGWSGPFHTRGPEGSAGPTTIPYATQAGAEAVAELDTVISPGRLADALAEVSWLRDGVTTRYDLGSSTDGTSFQSDLASGVINRVVFRPRAADTTFAMDFVPNGAPTPVSNRLCWLELCSTDFLDTALGDPFYTARLAVTDGGMKIGSYHFNGWSTQGDIDFEVGIKLLGQWKGDEGRLFILGGHDSGQFVIADNAVLSRDVPSANGFATLSINSSISNPCGIFRINASASPTVPVAVAVISSSLVIDYTTGILTGTTGVDGRFTISSHTDGKVYLENRSSLSLRISIDWQPNQ